MANVKIVAVAVTEAVMRELGMLHDNITCWTTSGQDAVLVVVEVAVAHGEARPLKADARAVVVRHLGAGKLHAFDRGVVAFDDPDGLAFCVRTVGVQPRAAGYAANGKAVLSPDCRVALVQRCIDFDDIAVARDAR